jgi:hypothetical protein
MSLKINSENFSIEFDIYDYELKYCPSLAVKLKILITNVLNKLLLEMDLWIELEEFNTFYNEVKLIRNLESNDAQLNDMSENFFLIIKSINNFSKVIVSFIIKNIHKKTIF